MEAGAAQVLRNMVASLILGTTDAALKETAEPYVRGLCAHFALLYAAGHGQGPRTPPPAGKPAARCMDLLVFTSSEQSNHGPGSAEPGPIRTDV